MSDSPESKFVLHMHSFHTSATLKSLNNVKGEANRVTDELERFFVFVFL